MAQNHLASAVRPSLGAGAVFFCLAFLSNLETLTDALLNGLLSAVVFGGICFLFAKSACRNAVAFQWWQWVPYFTGALIGCLSLLYWVVMYGIHIRKDAHRPFLNQGFHQRTYKLGLVLLPLFVVVGLLESLGLA